jgi:hypothetical protein
VSLVALLGLSLCVLATLVPVWLLRKEPRRTPQDFLVAAQPTPPSVVGNSAIALALRVAVLAPCFALGAGGDFWPVLVGGTSFALGALALASLRRPILAFVDEGLAQERSVTPAGFSRPPLRFAAAVLVGIALLVLLLLEARLTAEILSGALGATGAHLAVLGLVLVSGVAAWSAGNSGAMNAMQLQLGFLYLGLAGSSVLLNYLNMAAVAAPSLQGTVAVAGLAAICVALVLYRRNKYVDAKAVRRADVPQEALPTGERRASRLLAGFVRLFNRAITTLLIVAAVFAAMQLYFTGSWSGSARTPAETGLGPLWLVAIALTFLATPILDPGNWQRLAALRRYGTEDRESAAAVRRASIVYVVETPLICLAVALLGAIAARTGWDGAGGLAGYAGYLAEQRHVLASTALWFLLLATISAAVSSIAGTLQALSLTLYYDLFRRRRL